MPIKLKAPGTKSNRSKFYRVRGTHKGIGPFDRTTQEAARPQAQKFLDRFIAAIESGRETNAKGLTFDKAVIAYEAVGGDKRFLKPLVLHFGRTPVAAIDQAAIDAAAVAIYPDGAPATRNRQVYTPIKAVMKRNGISLALSRPKGAHGVRRTLWLRPEQFEAVASAAAGLDAQLGILMVLLCYTGMRLGEGLSLLCSDIDLANASAQLRKTKNGDPRAVHLPPRVIAALANHPRGLARGAERLFTFTAGRPLNRKVHKAYDLAEVECGDAPFHILRHTWATWMVRLGVDLVSTGAWRSHNSARGYTHFVTSEEARRADGLPGAMGTG